ncbi:peptidase U32 family protein [Flavihumibacter stibioxidans]|uniref:peptidase U32 family protein n=1 Tax=Flavihumibacter stibioxidans TaxID=1834163 RepID=UPI00164F9B38|nr:peptidase U32 family protein [Flavihumibacter stibioxidans]
METLTAASADSQPAPTTKKTEPELLAPAGSWESLQAAIRGGANAIYFGVEQLNMRAKSIHSFSADDLDQIAATCRENGIRTNITLNTVMYDHDLQLVKQILKKAKAAGIDAVIAADFAVLELCRQMKIPVHISTQANVSNIESVRFFSSFADVVVLARELTLGQIAAIKREINRKDIRGVSGKRMRIEVFVHGALCMAISGKCYLSLHTHNASANRGACTQNCRRPYTVTDQESGHQLELDHEYIMSPKDLCTIDVLDQVLATGVDILKIEGRGKGPEYTLTTTRCYREAMNAIAAGTYTPEKAAAWKTDLAGVYNRGFWEGYYLGRKLGEWTPQPGSAATEKKIYLGKCTGYYPKIGVAEFQMESGTLKSGDTILITGKKIGAAKMELEDFFVEGSPSDIAVPCDKITFPLAEKACNGDKLYKIVDHKTKQA